MPLIACLVCCWIRPAIAMAPPEGISSVVSARRVLIEGTVNELTVVELTACDSVIEFSFESSETSSSPHRDPALAGARRREVERDAELLEADLRRTDMVVGSQE